MDHAPAAALPKQKRLSIEEKLWHDLLFWSITSCFECFIVSQKVHLVDEKSRGNFKKSGYFAFGCFCLFLLEPVDAKTPDIYCTLNTF